MGRTDPLRFEVGGGASLLGITMEKLIHRHAKTLSLILIGFCVLTFLYASMYAFHYTWTSRRNAKASVNWPQTSGTVVLCRTPGPYEHGPPGRIEYIYAVDGVTYSSDVIVFGQSYSSEHFRLYTKDTRVTVTYDPEDASTSTLEPGVFTNYPPIVFGFLVLFCFGCFFSFCVCRLLFTLCRAAARKVLGRAQRKKK